MSPDFPPLTATVDHPLFKFIVGHKSIDEKTLQGWGRELRGRLQSAGPLRQARLLSAAAAALGELTQRVPPPQRHMLVARIRTMHATINQCLQAVLPAGGDRFSSDDRPRVDAVLAEQNFALRCAHRSLHHGVVMADQAHTLFKHALVRILRENLPDSIKPAHDAGRQIAELFLQLVRMEIKVEKGMPDRESVIQEVFGTLVSGIAMLTARQRVDALVGSSAFYALAERDEDTFEMIVSECEDLIADLPEFDQLLVNGRIDKLTQRGDTSFEDARVSPPAGLLI
ncbi:MAG: hypothetical protein ABW032_08785 [Burkholderiaceae bacterium]